MIHSGEKRKYTLIFLFVLYYIFVLSYFSNRFLFPHRFNAVIYLGLTMLIFTTNIFNFNRYFALVAYFFINFIIFMFYILEFNTMLNLTQLIVSVIFFSCLAYQITNYFNVHEIIELLKKHFQIIFFVAIIFTTVLTLANYPFIIDYFIWDTIFIGAEEGGKVLKFLSPSETGHSVANTILPILFCLLQYNFFTKKDKKLLTFLYMILIAFMCYLTRSRTTYFLILLFLLSSFTYLDFSWSKRYFKILIIVIGILFLSMSSKPTHSYYPYETKILNFVLTLDIFTSAESKLVTPERFYSARDLLNQRLLNKINERPFFGSGHTDDFFKYGIDRNLNIAYNLKKVAGSESLLIIPAKYGLPYFFILMFFIISIPFSFYNFKKDELALFQNFWTIIFVKTVSSGGFISMYGTSGWYFLFLVILYFLAKSKKIYP